MEITKSTSNTSQADLMLCLQNPTMPPNLCKIAAMIVLENLIKIRNVDQISLLSSFKSIDFPLLSNRFLFFKIFSFVISTEVSIYSQKKMKRVRR